MEPQRHPSRRNLLVWLAGAAPVSLLAQTPSFATPGQAELRGVTSGGEVLALNTLRGQVVMVFYWSTECPVCRNKMPELRANAAGWQGQKFTLLGVNMDQKREDFLRYEEVVTPLLPQEQLFPSVWGRDPAYQDNLGPVSHLPSTVLIDKQGQVAERYMGRIPPQAWNRIADLL
ncbi:hypothetical protein LPB72_05860 [Hydrogenophaga crassostreae]|uniref:Thioredoxin domain-containing protein n=1 Tax=Hydrogenophaga crassostreae TaxID=1763535 RepID=A0A162PB79_9BURK|nr:TlpA disulfide reductase family protein [Hydrogenophaga crassostreae]AOW14558.1 hypothetical protein LPB072_18690 [Hydrogenophaga crassostreae]OAD43345.1 hypothetical protein LPB72_05860 [Hydrogenophaga crassostreae]